jgi:3-phenylpropionate/trans-cinnamate dioxygenase ferredoxin subunit
VAEWIPVARLGDFAAGDPEDGQSLRVECGVHPIALFRLEEGLYALDDICSHEYSRLSEGEIWDGDVYCPKHGSRFDIRTGAVQGLPAIKPVRSYAVKVEGDTIYVRCEER